MIVKIDSVLESKNKTRNWLSQETGITYANISNLCNGKTTSVQFHVIDKICSVLECSISDIFEAEFIEINREIVYLNKIKNLNN